MDARLDTVNHNKTTQVVTPMTASDTTSFISSSLEPKTDSSPHPPELVTKKKVSISRGTDGKLQIIGLERGQQLLRTGDGRFVILSPRSKPKSSTASIRHPLHITEPHSDISGPGSGKHHLDSLAQATSPYNNQVVKSNRVVMQKPMRNSVTYKNLAMIKELPNLQRRPVDVMSTASIGAARTATNRLAIASPTLEETQPIPKIKKPVSSFGLGHKPNQVSLISLVY